MIRAIIIEDEQPARDLIKHYLSGNPNIRLEGEFSDGFSGLKGIHDLKPDLVFRCSNAKTYRF
jgi:two-component system LytT family response regulator